MGVTIHFEGYLKSESDYENLVATIINFAAKNDITYSLIKESAKTLYRVRDEKDWDYYGLVKGIKLQPDENSDPLLFEFDENNYIQEYCKTQFAGIETHVKIVKLLREIQKYFVDLSVTDEGEYWNSNDVNLLETLLNDYYEAAEKAKFENPKLNGPFRLEDGRIVDLMESE